jgi:hypothetical protein
MSNAALRLSRREREALLAIIDEGLAGLDGPTSASVEQPPSDA